MDLFNDRWRGFEEQRNKLVNEAEGLTGSMKEYLMKIIEVLLDKSEEEVKRGGNRKEKEGEAVGATHEQMKKLLRGELAVVEKEFNEKCTLLDNIKQKLQELE